MTTKCKFCAAVLDLKLGGTTFPDGSVAHNECYQLNMGYSELVYSVKQLSMSQLPGMLVNAIEACIEKKCFKPGGIARLAERIELGLGVTPEHPLTNNPLPCPFCGTPAAILVAQMRAATD